MISFELDRTTGVLTVRPQGRLEVQDFQALSETVDPFIEEKGRLAGLIIVTENFPGWKDLGGLLEHFKFVHGHHREIARVALVTDTKIADVAQLFGKHFVKASIKHFAFADLESAQIWVNPN